MKQTPFPIDFFPTELRDIILETSANYKFNNDFLCGSVLSACAGSIGNSFCVQVRGKWIERLSLYLSIVASPGINKSAPLSWALSPIEAREDEIFKVYRQMIKDFKQDPNNKDKQPPPIVKTIITDATPEAVIQQLNTNEKGILIYVDELSGFLDTFQRYSKGNDEQMYLSAWSGKTIVVDRKTSISLRIKNPVINIVGTIQPNLFDKIFSTKEDSGFFDRWLIINPLNAQKEIWSETEIRPEVYNNYERIINKLLNLQLYVNNFGETESRMVTYSTEAWNEIKEWQKYNTAEVNKTDLDFIKAIRAKMEIYIHRFALISHLMQYGCSNSFMPSAQIERDSAIKAIQLSNYFINNAIFARSSDKSIKLTEKWRELYDSLPENEVTFTMSEILDRANFLEIKEVSVKRWVKNSTGKLITKIKHGVYAKI